MTILKKLNPRYSIFSRVFLSFWGMLLILVALVFFALFFTSSQYVASKRIQQMEQISSLKKEISILLSEGQIDSVTSLLLNVKPHIKDQFRVYDDFGFELFDRYDELETIFLNPVFTQVSPIYHETVSDEFGLKYELFVRYQPRLNILFNRHPSGVALRFFIALFVSLIGCYFFTCTITRPVQRLQHQAKVITKLVCTQNYDNINMMADIKYGDDELGQLGQDISLMTKHLHNSIQQKRQLLQDVAHDLRAPLSRQSIALDMITNEQPEKFNSLKKQLIHDHEQLCYLVEQTLDWYRLNSMTLSKQKICLVSMCQDVINDAQFEFPSVIFTLTRDLHNNEIMANAYLLRSAIDNIVRNAGRFAQSDVSVSLLETLEGVKIQISDDGIGVPEDELKRIFEPFAQVDQARKPNIKKTAGLGLSIAKDAISKHGGEIYARTKKNRGLSVYINLFDYS